MGVEKIVNLESGGNCQGVVLRELEVCGVCVVWCVCGVCVCVRCVCGVRVVFVCVWCVCVVCGVVCGVVCVCMCVWCVCMMCGGVCVCVCVLQTQLTIFVRFVSPETGHTPMYTASHSSRRSAVITSNINYFLVSLRALFYKSR